MNLYRNFLRMLLSIGSVTGFVLGWAFLSNNQETTAGAALNTANNQPQGIQAVPTAAAVNGGTQSGLQLFNFQMPSAQSQQQMVQPQLRTGGS